MNRLLQKLMALWLAIALVVTPVVAFSASPVSGMSHCMMATPHQGDTPSASTSGSEQQQARTACKHCKDDSCADKVCSDQGCSAGHGTSIACSSGTSFVPVLSVIPAARLQTGLLSRSDPPLLRPPV